jgi:arylsulfatase A-like enzyme
MTDDMGYGDLGSYGARDIRTPNIDGLARGGVRLTDAYSNGPVCTPTRAALMTGRYQQRVGLEDVLNITPAHREKGLVATGETLPALLKKNGYVTALYGKWHLGFKPEFGPNAHGFDEFFGFLSGAVDYYTHQRNDGERDLVENGTPVEIREYLTDAIAQRGVTFIDRNVDRPFFLELSFNAPHWPFQPPDQPTRNARQRPGLRQTAADDPPPTRADYARMVERVDAAVGTVLKALERHRLAKHTLVIFTNDNGGEWLSRNAPFFHRKGTLWEGGIRVPLIIRWPDRLPAGRVSPQVAVTMDLTATILSATGSSVRAESRLDGIDLLPHLRDTQNTVDRRVFWRRPTPGVQLAVRDGRWKLFADGANLFLFDLSADPGERNDLSRERPDVVRRLSQALEAWFTEMNTASKAS